MGTYPWGPHGPQVPANTVPPNPTAASPAPAFEQPDYSAPMTGGGGGGGLGAILANIIFSLVMFFCLWEAIACLYPLTALAAIATGLVTRPILLRALPADGADVASVVAIAAGIVVAFILSRIEYRLAQNTGFRIGRHIVRLVLLSIWAIPIIMLSTGVTAPSTTTRFILAVVSSPATMVRFLSNPMTLGIWAAVMVGLHFVIWNWKSARQFWHNRLKWIGLK